MNDLKVFSNTEFGELGVMVIDGKEYFPATQCAKLLGYANAKDAVIRHCKGVVKHDLPTNGGKQEVNYIPEGDLYRLIVSSKLPAAEKFERWVFDEVLPSIRKNGGYGDIDIQSIIAQTAAAAVGEVMKQLVPVIAKASAAAASGRTASEIVTASKPQAKKYVYHQPSKMELLPPEVKERSDEMLASGQYSCREVANFIINETGIYISVNCVARYKRQQFAVVDSEQVSFF